MDKTSPMPIRDSRNTYCFFQEAQRLKPSDKGRVRIWPGLPAPGSASEEKIGTGGLLSAYFDGLTGSMHGKAAPVAQLSFRRSNHPEVERFTSTKKEVPVSS